MLALCVQSQTRSCQCLCFVCAPYNGVYQRPNAEEYDISHFAHRSGSAFQPRCYLSIHMTHLHHASSWALNIVIGPLIILTDSNPESLITIHQALLFIAASAMASFTKHCRLGGAKVSQVS